MATAAANSNISNSREARRRRIVERGADRLALITSHIQTLPPQSAHSPSATCPPSISDDNRPHLQPSDLSSPTDSCQSEDKVPASLLSSHDSISATHQQNPGVGPFMRKCETSLESSIVPALDLESKDQSSPVSSSLQNPGFSASEADHRFQPQIRRFKFCTPKKISSAITTSENTRMYCALAAALIVVLSYVRFPIFGSKIVKSVIFFRPLYLLLLTNISIVAAKLLEQKQRGSERTEQQTNSVRSNVGYGLADQLGDALEIGLVLQKVLGALFIDCSIYSVIVICGLSMAGRLGW